LAVVVADFHSSDIEWLGIIFRARVGGNSAKEAVLTLTGEGAWFTDRSLCAKVAVGVCGTIT
jgi:hypothetical protein